MPATFVVNTPTDDAAAGLTLREAINSANSTAGTDSITFSFAMPATITLKSALPEIHEALTIDGPGPNNLTVSGDNAFAIFGAATDQAVVFKDLTVANGRASTGNVGSHNGGAFHFGAFPQITIDNCVVTNNRANDGDGGAIDFRGFSTYHLTITNSTFSNNQADGAGGAIFFQQTSSATGTRLTITDSTFTNNTAFGSGGGAIACAATMSVTDSTFTNNDASFFNGNGGAIAGGINTIVGCTFVGNSADDLGGAMSCATALIQNSTITGNDAGSGGAVAVASTLTVQNSTITGNSATVAGGGFYQASGPAETIITDSTVIQGNTAPSGPDVSTEGTLKATTTAIGSKSGVTTFNNVSGNLIGDPNIKLSPLGNYGGPTQTQRPLPGSSLLNKGSNPAGLIRDQRGSPRVFGAAADIGAVEFHDGETLGVDTTADESDGDFSPGDLSLREAVELSNSYTETVETISFATSAFPSGFQTTIALTLGEMAISDSVFIVPFGRAAVDAGGKSRIFNLTTAASPLGVTIYGMKFANGLAKSGVEFDGGAVLIGDDSVNFTTCEFTGNHANAEGGAVGVLNTASDVTFDRCTFTNNSAGGNAGAVNLDSGAGTTFSTCTFTGNSAATGDGGAVYVTNGAVTIDGCEFSGNAALSAASDGGALYVNGAGAMTISDSAFDGNSAFFGGGLYFQSAGTLTMTNCAVTNNQATGASGLGGGIFLQGGTATLRNSTVSDNEAGGSGGGVDLNNFNGTLTLQNCTLTANTAGISGGGIARSSGTGIIAMESCIVSDNINATSPNILTSGTVIANSCAITDKTGMTGTFTDQGGNITTATNLKLAPLADNGGTGLTHALLDGSPCLNKGSNPLSLTTDQRGPGFPRANGTTDMGAYEQPKTFVVTILQDENDGNFAANDISLREAVVLAEATQDTQDRIEFAVAGTINLVLGQITITDPLIIAGNGAVQILGAGTRLFNIVINSTVLQDVRISGLTMVSGSAAASGSGGAINSDNAELTVTAVSFVSNQAINGGAIFFQQGSSTAQALTLNSCTLVNNHANTGFGGAVYYFGTGRLTISASNLSSNIADANGGAVYCSDPVGSLAISRSTLSANTADQGGGIYINGPVSGGARFALSIIDSTLSSNKAAAGRGGGLYLGSGPDGIEPALIRNSTFSANSASTAGGAIAFVGKNILRIENSTLTSNSATSEAGGLYSDFTNVNTIDLESTIVFGNNAPANPDIRMFFVASKLEAKNSAIGNSNSFTYVDLGGNLPFGTNVKLGPLADNGGPTKTHALLLGSPAMDQGSNPGALDSDQRGSGFARVSGPAADIGAFERPTTVVTNMNDSGPGSLRDAILNANSLVGTDAVTFDPTVFATAKTITLTTGELLITDSVAVIGPAAGVKVSGNSASRAFHLDGTGTLDVNMSGLTITGGLVTGLETGGGILSAGENLTLDQCNITGNTAPFEGGINVTAPGYLVLTGCQVTNNSSSSGVGGIAAVGGAKIVRSSISGNTTGGTTGGIYASLVLVMTDSTIAGNSAGTAGGGLRLSSSGTITATITNSTISGNTTATSGGGIDLGFLTPFNGTLTVQNSTITANKATSGTGGGIARLSGTGTVTLISTVVAQNINSAADDLSFNTSSTVAGNNNLIGVADKGSFTLSGANNLTGTQAAPLNAKLGPLQNNGGPTLTHGLLAGSPAINAGSNLATLPNDQRGAGFARVVGGTADIGAFEVQVLPPCVVGKTVIINGGAAQRSRVTEIKVDFDQVVSLPVPVSNAFELKRQSDNALVDLSFSVTVDTATHVKITFVTALSEFGSLQDGRYTLTIFASKVSNANGSLDGDCNGIGGDDFVLVGSPANGLFRLFGDADGNATVNSTDFGVFRTFFGLGASIFDFNGDNVTNSNDFAEFRRRFGLTI